MFIKTLSNIKKIFAGATFSFALDINGLAYSFGENSVNIFIKLFSLDN
jgi:alpha-tubulin suppressor-like RCC1 family protein